jgi:hypothetical protein
VSLSTSVAGGPKGVQGFVAHHGEIGTARTAALHAPQCVLARRGRNSVERHAPEDRVDAAANDTEAPTPPGPWSRHHPSRRPGGGTGRMAPARSGTRSGTNRVEDHPANPRPRARKGGRRQTSRGRHRVVRGPRPVSIDELAARTQPVTGDAFLPEPLPGRGSPVCPTSSGSPSRASARPAACTPWDCSTGMAGWSQCARTSAVTTPWTRRSARTCRPRYWPPTEFDDLICVLSGRIGFELVAQAAVARLPVVTVGAAPDRPCAPPIG